MPFGGTDPPIGAQPHKHTNAAGDGGALDGDVTLVDVDTVEDFVIIWG